MSDQIDSGSRSSARRTAEEPIEARRYLDALRRSLPLVIGIVVVLARLHVRGLDVAAQALQGDREHRAAHQ